MPDGFADRRIAAPAGGGGTGRRWLPSGWGGGSLRGAQPQGEHGGGKQEKHAGHGEPVPQVGARGQGGRRVVVGVQPEDQREPYEQQA
jgi:hypothetical protein